MGGSYRSLKRRIDNTIKYLKDVEAAGQKYRKSALAAEIFYLRTKEDQEDYGCYAKKFREAEKRWKEYRFVFPVGTVLKARAIKAIKEDKRVNGPF